MVEAVSFSKASVQTVFGTRKFMVEALLSRYLRKEEKKYQTILGNNHTADSRLKAQLQSTRQGEDNVGRAVSTLLAILISGGKVSSEVQGWCQVRMDDLNARDLDSRKRRLTYLAAEGAFLLRSLVGLRVTDERWSEFFNDIEEILK